MHAIHNFIVVLVDHGYLVVLDLVVLLILAIAALLAFAGVLSVDGNLDRDDGRPHECIPESLRGKGGDVGVLVVVSVGGSPGTTNVAAMSSWRTSGTPIGIVLLNVVVVLFVVVVTVVVVVGPRIGSLDVLLVNVRVMDKAVKAV